MFKYSHHMRVRLLLWVKIGTPLRIQIIQNCSSILLIFDELNHYCTYMHLCTNPISPIAISPNINAQNTHSLSTCNQTYQLICKYSERCPSRACMQMESNIVFGKERKRKEENTQAGQLVCFEHHVHPDIVSVFSKNKSHYTA